MEEDAPLPGGDTEYAVAREAQALLLQKQAVFLQVLAAARLGAYDSSAQTLETSKPQAMGPDKLDARHDGYYILGNGNSMSAFLCLELPWIQVASIGGAQRDEFVPGI